MSNADNMKLIRLFLELPVVRVRDIGGNIIKTHTTCPKGVTTVPCLGQRADALVDSLGYTGVAVCCIHSLYLVSCQSRGVQEKDFVRAMAEYGVPLMEGAMLWEAITITPETPVVTRERFML